MMDKKQAIFDAMLELVSQQGFHATPMSMVAKKAHVATGTIYHYFESKDQLIIELYQQLSAEIDLALLPPDSEQKTYKEHFFQLWIVLYAYFLSKPMHFQFLAQYQHSPYANQGAEPSMIPNLLKLLQDGMKLGVLREMNIELMYALVLGNITATVKIEINKPQHITKSILQSAIQSCWDAAKIN